MFQVVEYFIKLNSNVNITFSPKTIKKNTLKNYDKHIVGYFQPN